MKVRILRPALEDMAAGREFYDRQREGIGGYFFDSLFAEIDSLVLYAGIHRIQFGHHRLLAKRFPYAIYYRVAGGEAAGLSLQRIHQDLVTEHAFNYVLWATRKRIEMDLEDRRHRRSARRIPCPM